MGLFGIAKPRERGAIRSARGGKGVGTLPLGNAIFPIQSITAALECRHDMAEFWVNRTAVIALIIVFNDDLPIGGHFIGQRRANSQIGKRVVFQSLGSCPQ